MKSLHSITLSPAEDWRVMTYRSESAYAHRLVPLGNEQYHWACTIREYPEGEAPGLPLHYFTNNWIPAPPNTPRHERCL